MIRFTTCFLVPLQEVVILIQVAQRKAKNFLKKQVYNKPESYLK